MVVIVFTWINDLKAQDPRLSQFYAAPFYVNPAMTGVFEGRFRVNANYRDQWSSVLGSVPFRTFAAGFDLRYRIVGEDYVAFGFNAMRDEVGEGHYVQNRSYFNASYLKKVGGNKYTTSNQYLIAGGQVGVGQNAVEWNKFWFSEQYDLGNGGFPNLALPNGEGGILGESQTTDIFLDVNAGLLYYALFASNKSIYIGASVHHLNAPEISFFGNGNETLEMKWVGHMGGELPFNDQLSVLPALIFMKQGSSTSTTFGANVRYNNHDWNEVAIRAGIWPHISSSVNSRMFFEALTFATILEINRWNVGLSYDVTTSNLKAANNSRGAFEMSLIYTHRARHRVKTSCPKF